MKVRESGMPAEELWETFFRPDDVLDRLGFTVPGGGGNVVEFGCGYGTFTLPVARRTAGTVYAFDIEAEMVERTRSRATIAGLTNVVAQQRDFVELGTGLAPNSAEYVMLFNLLHGERPGDLLVEANRVLVPGGQVAIIHWNYDATTPRGPSMAIRVRPEQCRDWCVSAGFELITPGTVSLPPYHFGLVARRPVAATV